MRQCTNSYASKHHECVFCLHLRKEDEEDEEGEKKGTAPEENAEGKQEAASPTKEKAAANGEEELDIDNI